MTFEHHLWNGNEHSCSHLDSRKQENTLVTFQRSHSRSKDCELLKDRYYLITTVSFFNFNIWLCPVKVWMNEGGRVGLAGSQNKNFCAQARVVFFCFLLPLFTTSFVIDFLMCFLQIVVVYSLLGLIFSYLNCFIVLGLNLKFFPHVQISNQWV